MRITLVEFLVLQPFFDYTSDTFWVTHFTRISLEYELESQFKFSNGRDEKERIYSRADHWKALGGVSSP